MITNYGIIDSIKYEDNFSRQLKQSDKNQPELHVLKTDFADFVMMFIKIVSAMISWAGFVHMFLNIANKK